MIKFILNNQTIETDLPEGMTVLDFVRYAKSERNKDRLPRRRLRCLHDFCRRIKRRRVNYRTQTSCLMPLANAYGKHIVTVEGINKPNGELTPVQNSMVEESGTQCGFCTVGFVMSLTGFLYGRNTEKNGNGSLLN